MWLFSFIYCIYLNLISLNTQKTCNDMQNRSVNVETCNKITKNQYKTKIDKPILDMWSKCWTGALKSRDLTSRDLTTWHQIKQIATGWTSVGPRKNWTCWTISELNPVCHDSTAALRPIVACSFCVQSAILSALIRSPYSRGSTTEATATAARTKTRTGMALSLIHIWRCRRRG